MKKQSLTVLVGAALLSACGGGSSSDGDDNSSSNTRHVQGKAIDGYISGATVYLDFNFNNQKDANEPSTVTTAGGSFEFNLDEQYASCYDYVPVVVDVPVGAMDEDLGEITEAYTMVIPPKEIIPTDSDIANVTPLTTVLWNSIQTELAKGTMGEVSCAGIRDNADLRNQLQTRLEQQEWRLANRYGVTATELYSDFIATGNTRLHDTAMALVPAMQKSFDATAQAIEENPNAEVVYVEFYHGEWDHDTEAYDDKWYKETYVSPGQGQFKTSIVEMNEALTTVVAPVYLADMMTVSREGFDFEYVKEYQDGGCSVSESATMTSNPSWSLRNTSSAMGFNNLTQCETLDLEATLSGRAVTVRHNLPNEELFGEFNYFGTNLIGFDHLLNMRDNLPTIAASDLNELNFIVPDYDDVAVNDADVAQRSTSSHDGEKNITIQRDLKTGKFTKNELFDSGISKDYCSDDGVVWNETDDWTTCLI